MHFSSDIWWSSVHIRHSHARWGTSCSLCHKHTGNLVLEGLTHICFFIKLFNWSMMKLMSGLLLRWWWISWKGFDYKIQQIQGRSCTCYYFALLLWQLNLHFFSCWIFQGNCKIDSYDASEALVIKELLLFFIMIKQHTFFIVLFTLHCDAWFLDSDNRHSLLWKAFYLLILFPTISHRIS